MWHDGYILLDACQCHTLDTTLRGTPHTPALFLKLGYSATSMIPTTCPLTNLDEIFPTATLFGTDAFLAVEKESVQGVACTGA